MKNFKLWMLVFCMSAFCIAVSPALAALPKKHKEYLKNEYYKDAFETFTAAMEEIKEKFTPDEYKAFEKEIDEATAVYEKAAAEVEDALDADVYGEIYARIIDDLITEELRWDRLRKNAEGVQGFYRLKSSAFEGYMAVEKYEKGDKYGVEIRVTMKNEPRNSGYFEGDGKLSGGEILAYNVYEGNEEDVVTINFDGETAKVKANQAFKDGGALGAGVTIDGEYVREYLRKKK